MTTPRPIKIPSRPQTTDGKNGSRKWWSRSTTNRYEPVVRRKAWYLQTCMCCEMTEDNMEELRKKLSVCQAVKTTLKLTPQTLSWGRRGRNQRIKRTKLLIDEVQSVEQDLLFVNVLLCILELSDMPNNIKYQITAFKFHDTADVRAFVRAFQAWTGVVDPIDKAPSMVNGSVIVRSVAGGSMHSLAMPGRPTNGSLAPDRWVAVERPPLRRGLSASMGNLTAPSEVFYSDGIRTVARNGLVQGAGGRSHVYGSSVVGYRTNRAATEHQTVTSDEGNGSLTFSDSANQQQWRHHVTYSDVKTSTRRPVDVQDQRHRSQYQSNVTGSAVVMTGGGGSGGGESTRLTRSSGIGRESHDFDDLSDDVSSMSGLSSAFGEPEPGLTARNRVADGVATAYVNGNGPRRTFNGVFVEEDDYDSAQRAEPKTSNGVPHMSSMVNGNGSRRPLSVSYDEDDGPYIARRVEPMTSNGVPQMSSTVYRTYSRPTRVGSDIGLADHPQRRSRYQSDSHGYMHEHSVPVRSRSVGPIQSRYARSDLGFGGGPVVVVDNSDAGSIAASTYSLRTRSVMINPTLEKRYVSRQTNSIYRQVPRPVHGSSSSGYGGVRSRTMSHRMR